MRAIVLVVARAVAALALTAGAAALVIAVSVYGDGLTGLKVLAILVFAAPPVVLWVLWAALRELAGLPERLRRLPQAAREAHVDLQRLAGELRAPGGRLVRLPGVLWRLRPVAGTALELARPYAPLLPFLKVPFLTVSAIAAAAAVVEIAIALVVIVGAILG